MLLEHLKYIVDNIDHITTKLTQDILNIHGWSGNKGRIFLNELCSLEETNYLEIGTFNGSTAISAAYLNPGKFTCNDDFSQYGGKDVLLDNITKFNCNINLIEGNCYTLDKSIWPKDINIYFFDGPHSHENHVDAITHFVDILAKEAIIIIDDWDGKEAKEGTLEGIAKSNIDVLEKFELGHLTNSDRYGWWNGFGVFYIRKNKCN